VFVALRRKRVAPQVEPQRTPTVPVDVDVTHRVLRALPFAALVFHRNGRVTYLSSAAESLFRTRKSLESRERAKALDLRDESLETDRDRTLAWSNGL
jgi:hypothetical protein